MIRLDKEVFLRKELKPKAVMLKQIKKEALKEDMLLIEKISRSKEQIKEGKFAKADTKMRDEEIDDLLMG